MKNTKVGKLKSILKIAKNNNPNNKPNCSTPKVRNSSKIVII